MLKFVQKYGNRAFYEREPSVSAHAAHVVKVDLILWRQLCKNKRTEGDLLPLFQLLRIEEQIPAVVGIEDARS